MFVSRALLRFTAVVLAVLSPVSLARAEAPVGPHRIGLEVAPYTVGVYDSHDAYDKDASGLALGASYAYRAGRHVEVGASLGATRVDGGTLWLVRPQALLRAFVPLADDRLELGASVKLGAFFGAIDDRNVSGNVVGPLASLGLDARYWVAPRVALSLGVTAEAGSGKATGTPTRGAGMYLESSGMVVGTLLPSAGAVLAF